MSLCDARIGLGAQLSPTAMKIIECYIDFDKILLEQRMMQSQVAGEGAKGSGESAYEDKMAQAAVTQQEGVGMISNGSISLAFQGYGFYKGERLNGQIEEAQSKANNCDAAIRELEQGTADYRVVPGDASTAAPPRSVFEDRYVNENGFKYGDKLDPNRSGDMRKSTNPAEKRRAIEKAEERKKEFSNKVSSLTGEKQNFVTKWNTFGSGLASAVQGSTKLSEKTHVMDQALWGAVRAGTDFLSNTASSLASTLDQAYSTVYGHIAEVLKTDDALFQADSMRG